MAFETTRRNDLESAIEALTASKAELSKKRPERPAESIKSFSPARGNMDVKNDDFHERENKLLREQLVYAQSNYRNLMNQYEELYHYCESLLNDADKRRKEVESQRDAVSAKNGELLSQLKTREIDFHRMETALTEVAQARRIAEQSIAEKTADLAEAYKKIEEQKLMLAEISEKFEVSRSQEAYLRNQVTQVQSSGERERGMIDRMTKNIAVSVRNMDELCAAVAQYFDRILNQGESSLTPKAGKILIEQLRMELNALRKGNGSYTEAKPPVRIVNEIQN